MEEDYLDIGFVDPSILEDVSSLKPDTDKVDDAQTEREVIDKEQTEETGRVEDSIEQGQNGSPNLSSSIAEALVDSGVLQTLSKERLAEIKDAESLIVALQEDQRNQLDERQQRVDDLLHYGMEPSRISKYEQLIDNLNEVSDDVLEAEGEDYEEYRKNLLMTYYRAKGFEDDDALELINRALDGGKDIDDAKKAVKFLRTFYQDAYNAEINQAKQQYAYHVENQKKQLENLRTSILDDKENFYEQFEIGKSMRQRIFDVVAKPSIKDGNTKITPMQKFIKDDPNKANKIIGTLYVLTDGFTKFDGILKGTVKKQVRNSMKDLERALNQTKPSDGSMTYKTGLSDDLSNFKLLDFDI